MSDTATVIPADDTQWNPPDGGLTLDDLFPNPELTPQGAAPVVQQTPQAPPVEPFLKTSTTTYKTLEEAVRGTEEKDRTVERLKTELAQLKQTHQATPTQSAPAEDYRKVMFRRLAKAAQDGNEAEYMDALAEFQTSVLSQFAPALTGVYEQQAISAVESEVKDFRSWLNGPEYTRTLEQFPVLANAIQIAKSDPRAAHQLNEFYKLAYRAYAGDPARANETSTAVARSSVAPAPTPTRPTLQANTPTPVISGLPQNIGAPYTREQIMNNRALRTEFLKRFTAERSQALEKTFGELGL